MTKQLLTIEFSYNDVPKGEYDSQHKSKTITIGVYDTFEEACISGNKTLEILENKFDLHTFPDGRKANKERFSKKGGCFGSKNSLVANLAYLRTPFEFYAKITTLNYEDIEQTIFEVLEAGKRYKEFRNSQKD